MSTKGRASPSGPAISERFSDVSFSVSSVDANSTADKATSVSGARVTDTVTVNQPVGGLTAGLILNAWVSDEGEVTLRIANVTTADITSDGFTVDLELHKHSS